MAKIYKGTLGLIGNTPLVEVVNIEKELGLEATILVKLEYFNPAGSVKDRIAKAMIEDAEAKGRLKSGAVIIEPTSGNTGIGLAAIAAAKGYRIILTMPETMSVERRNILKAYGAEIVAQALKVLDRVAACFGHSFRYTDADMGGCALDKYGDPLPESELQKCKTADSVLLGAVGGNKWNDVPADKRPEKGLLRLEGNMDKFRKVAKIKPEVPHKKRAAKAETKKAEPKKTEAKPETDAKPKAKVKPKAAP